MSVSTMNIDKVKGHLVRWQYAIFLQENDERHLTDILRDLSTEADGAVFKGNYHSVNELREQLYDVRLQVYISSVVIQEAISHLRVLDPLLGVQFSATLDVKIKLVMNLLHYEIDSYPLVTNTALLSANHVFMNKWLMHKYSQEFEMYVRPFPHPGGTDPFALYTESQSDDSVNAKVEQAEVKVEEEGVKLAKVKLERE